MKVRMIELFAGYGSQSLAMKRLVKEHPEVEFEPVAFAEIDKYAIKAYRALHGDDIPNLGDVSAVDWSSVPACDLLTYSFPCTDISMAGRQDGLKEGTGTASSLLWECRRAIQNIRPKYAVMENVANLLSKRHKPEFDRWCKEMEDMGYVNYYQILNAKDYNVPQNRRRIFMVSIFGGRAIYNFPQPITLRRHLNSMIEKHVPEYYYLSEERVKSLLSSAKLDNMTSVDSVVLGWTRDKKGEIVDRHPVNIANCVTASKRDNTQNYVLEYHIAAMRGRADGDWFESEHKQRLEINKDGVCNTLTGVAKDNLLMEKSIDRIRIRRLTERELFRLMDVDEIDIERLLSAGISKTQLQKMAGNSICVSCLYEIFKSLFFGTEKVVGQMKLF